MNDDSTLAMAADRLRLRRAAALASRERHPDEAMCLNCGWAISDHPEMRPATRKELGAPRRICPTAVFAVTLEELNAAVDAGRAEYRSQRALDLYGEAVQAPMQRLKDRIAYARANPAAEPISDDEFRRDAEEAQAEARAALATQHRWDAAEGEPRVRGIGWCYEHVAWCGCDSEGNPIRAMLEKSALAPGGYTEDFGARRAIVPLDQLTPAQAYARGAFDLGAELTTNPEPLTLSAAHDAAPVVERVKRVLERHGIPDGTEPYPERHTPINEEPA